MRLKSIVLLLFVALPILSFAQGVITVFSEDGDKFFLVINGVKQNPTPQTNVRVDGLVAVNYRAKVVFEDTSKEEISNNVYTQNALTHEYVEATYRIKRTKKGELKLRLFSSTPVPPTFNPPPDMYVAHFGTVSQTTTSTTTNTRVNTNVNTNINTNLNTNIDLNANMNGSMNVNVNLGGQPNGQYNPQAGQRPMTGNADCHWPMDDNAFQTLMAGLRNELSSDRKADMALSTLATTCMSTDQIIEISKLLSTDIDRLIFVRKAYPRVTDQGSYSRVRYIFQDELRIKEFDEFVANGGKQ